MAKIEIYGNHIVWRELGLRPMGIGITINGLNEYSDIEFTYEEYNDLLQNFEIFRKDLYN